MDKPMALPHSKQRPATPEDQMAVYRATARRRRQREEQALEAYRRRALAMARAAAILLKEEHGVEQVVLFGSLARGGPISLHTDVDLAVWGLAEADYLRVLSRLLALDPPIEVDLVMDEDAPPTLKARIAAEGVLL